MGSEMCIRDSSRISSDLAIQIFDINQNGSNEVIVVFNDELQIRSGLTGKVLRSRKLPEIYRDAIYIGNVGKKKRIEPGIIVKDRYSQVRAYSSKLRLLWRARGNTGHFPKSYDMDNDGIEEHLIGFTMYSATGKKIWRNKFKRHNDAADIKDMDGDGVPEIALASSGISFLLDNNGNVIWEQPHLHSQHAVIGNFLWDKPSERQAAFVDRGQDGSIFVYDKAGNEIYSKAHQGWRTIVSSVDGWTGNENESLLLAYRRLIGPPVLLDSAGNDCLLYTSPSPRDATLSRMPSSA